MRHKVRVYSYLYGDGERLWYMICRCGEGFPNRRPGSRFYGRLTWDAAFALAVAHLRDKDCKHG